MHIDRRETLLHPTQTLSEAMNSATWGCTPAQERQSCTVAANAHALTRPPTASVTHPGWMWPRSHLSGASVGEAETRPTAATMSAIAEEAPDA